MFKKHHLQSIIHTTQMKIRFCALSVKTQLKYIYIHRVVELVLHKKNRLAHYKCWW